MEIVSDLFLAICMSLCWDSSLSLAIYGPLIPRSLFLILMEPSLVVMSWVISCTSSIGIGLKRILPSCMIRSMYWVLFWKLVARIMDICSCIWQHEQWVKWNSQEIILRLLIKYVFFSLSSPLRMDTRCQMDQSFHLLIVLWLRWWEKLC